MRYTLLAILLIGTGCATQSSKLAPAVKADESLLVSIRGDFARAGVDARVGAVTQVLADQPFLSASGASLWDFPVGSTITVADTNKVTLAHGTVVAHVGSEVHASFVVAGQRGPKPGDIIVRFP